MCIYPATRLHDIFAPAPNAGATPDSTIKEEEEEGGGGGGGKRESRPGSYPGSEEGPERGTQDLQPHTQTFERLEVFEAELVEVEGNISQILRDHTDVHGAVVGEKHKSMLEQSARQVDSIQADLSKLTETLSAQVKETANDGGGFELSGAFGANAPHAQGVFYITEEQQNGKPVYLKVGSHSYCCWHTLDGQWLVSTMDAKDANNAVGFAHTVLKELDAPQLAKEWTVFQFGAGSAWQVQPTVTITTRTQPEVQAAITACSIASAAPGFKISGASGIQAKVVNGVYAKSAEQQNGKPVYVRVGAPDARCWFNNSELRWLVTKADSSLIFACSVEFGLEAPQVAIKWNVRESPSKDTIQTSVTATSMDDAELAAAVTTAFDKEQAALAAPGFRLTGVTGEKKPLVNGIYSRSTESKNGKQVYLKVGSSKVCCWYTPDKKWMVSLTDRKDANQIIGWAESTEVDLAAPQLALQWNVTPDNVGWKIQPGIMTSNCTPKEHRDIMAMNAAVLQSTRISIGTSSYDKMVEIRNGHAIYKSKCDKYCWYNPDNQWMVSPLVNVNANQSTGHEHSVAVYLDAPHLARDWSIYNSAAKAWQVQGDLSISAKQISFSIDALKRHQLELMGATDVFGAPGFTLTGTDSARCDGIYLRTDQTQIGSKPVYQKLGDLETCCWCTKAKQWVVGKRSDRELGKDVGFVFSAELGLAAPQFSNVIKTVANGKLSIKPGAAVATFTTEEYQAIAMMHTTHTNAPGFEISGATGNNAASVNSGYLKTSERSNGKPVYLNMLDSTKCCFFTTSNTWVVGTMTAKDANKNEGWAQSVQKGLDAPQLAKNWTVYDGAAWVAQASVTVDNFTKDDGERYRNHADGNGALTNAQLQLAQERQTNELAGKGGFTDMELKQQCVENAELDSGFGSVSNATVAVYRREQAAHLHAGLGSHTVAELTTRAIDAATSRIAAEKATKKSQNTEARAAWFERWGAGFVHTKKDDGKDTLDDVVTPGTHAMIVAWVQASLKTSSSAPSYTTLKAEALEKFSEAEWDENKASIKQLLMLKAPATFPPGPIPTAPPLAQVDIDAVAICMALECTTSFSFFTRRSSCNVCAGVLCKECISDHADMPKGIQVCVSCAAMISERVELDSVELIEWANKEAMAQVTAARCVRAQCEAAEDAFARKEEAAEDAFARKEEALAALHAKVYALVGTAEKLATNLASQSEIDATATKTLATAKLASAAAELFLQDNSFSQFQVPAPLEIKVTDVERTLSLLNEINEVVRGTTSSETGSAAPSTDLGKTVETRDQARMAYLTAVSTLVSAAFACLARCKNATSVVDVLESSSVFSRLFSSLEFGVGSTDDLFGDDDDTATPAAPASKKGGLFDSDDDDEDDADIFGTDPKAKPKPETAAVVDAEDNIVGDPDKTTKAKMKMSEKKAKSDVAVDSVDTFAEGPVALMAVEKAIAKWKVSKQMLMSDQTIASAPEDATIAIDASFPVAEVVEAIKWMKVAAPLAIERFADITTIAEHHQVIAGAMKEWSDPNAKKGLLAGIKLARDAKRKTRKQLKRAQLTLEEAADSDGSGGDDDLLEAALQTAKSAYSKAVKAENKIRAKLAIAIRDHYPELFSMLDIHRDPIYKLMEQLKSVPVYESRVHYELGDQIQGGTHDVQRATNTISPDDSDSQTEVVLKRFVLGDASSRKTFEKEITILARMRHPNVIRLTGVVYEPKNAVAYLELPYLASGDLRAHLGAKEANRGTAVVQQVFSDLCKALDYLHTSGVVHCDVKPDNILIDENGTAKLTDFDVSKDARSRALAVGTTASTTKAIGGLTYGYAAPEVMATAAGGGGGGGGSAAATANEMPGTPADMWSAGCVLFFMAFYPRELTLETGKAPTAQLPAKCDAAIRSLLTALWVHQPSKRPTAAETLTAPYFAVDVAVAVEPPAHAVPFDRDHWSSSNKAGADARKRFLVDSTSDEYKTVAASFFKTQTDKNIDSIERIENGALQESFATSERNMREQLKSWDPAATSSSIVKQLFHGTKAVDLIVNSTDGHGFLPLLAGTAVGAIWGDGTYFARDAKYSDAYAEQLPSGRKQMLVVDVLVGRYTQGVKGMKMCPLLPGEKYNRYNSLVDNTQHPGIFVVQHSDQAYPKYVITYH